MLTLTISQPAIWRNRIPELLVQTAIESRDVQYPDRQGGFDAQSLDGVRTPT
jgi:hypothetical protein